MKKVLTIAVAAVMAFSLSMPAFAAATEGQMANEGKLVQQIGSALAENNVPAATEAAKQVVSAISGNDSDVSKTTAQHIGAVLDKTSTTEGKSDVSVGSETATVAFVGEGSTGSAVTVNSLKATPATADAPLTVTIDASVSGTQSGLGYLVSFVLPTGMLNSNGQTTNYNTSNVYLTSNGQKLDTVTSVINRADGGVIITAWVPHFSTYNVVLGSSVQVNQPDLTPDNGGNGGNGGDQGGNNGGDNGGSNTPAATPAPAPAAANPIKKTGADMSVALTALAVVAGVALVGGVVAMKKSDLDQ